MIASRAAGVSTAWRWSLPSTSARAKPSQRSQVRLTRRITPSASCMWSAQGLDSQRSWGSASMGDLHADDGAGVGVLDPDAAAVGRHGQLAEGQAEGRTQGRTEQAITSARAMLADGLPPATVAKYTGLTIAEVQALVNE